VEPPTNGDSCHSGVLPQDAAFFNAVHKEVLTVNRWVAQPADWPLRRPACSPVNPQLRIRCISMCRHIIYAACGIIRLSQNAAQKLKFFTCCTRESCTHNLLRCMRRHFSYAARAIIRLSQNNAQKRNFFTCCTGQLGMGMRKSLLAHGQTYNTVRSLLLSWPF
jgi:hypothetical protein